MKEFKKYNKIQEPQVGWKYENQVILTISATMLIGCLILIFNFLT